MLCSTIKQNHVKMVFTCLISVKHGPNVCPEIVICRQIL